MQGSAGDVREFVTWLALAAVAPVVFLPTLWPSDLARTLLGTAGELPPLALGVLGLAALAGAVVAAPD